jgi:endogenous inhibitor of DNA gyrase (YacG/DUF329 family)
VSDREQAEKRLIGFLLERERHRVRQCGVCKAWYVVGVDVSYRAFCSDACKREAELRTKREWWTKNYGAHNEARQVEGV